MSEPKNTYTSINFGSDSDDFAIDFAIVIDKKIVFIFKTYS